MVVQVHSPDAFLGFHHAMRRLSRHGSEDQDGGDSGSWRAAGQGGCASSAVAVQYPVRGLRRHRDFALLRGRAITTGGEINGSMGRIVISDGNMTESYRSWKAKRDAAAHRNRWRDRWLCLRAWIIVLGFLGLCALFIGVFALVVSLPMRLFL